jgi:hypothetical protein
VECNDHRTPTSPGGFHRADNPDFVCERCNEVKGSLLDTEMFELLALVGRWGPVTRRDFLARLRAGGKSFASERVNAHALLPCPLCDRHGATSRTGGQVSSSEASTVS